MVIVFIYFVVGEREGFVLHCEEKHVIENAI